MSLVATKKKKFPAWIILILLCVVAALALGFSMSRGMEAQRKKSREDLDRLVVTASTGDIIQEVTETGPLEAQKTVEIKSRVAGRIRQLLVDEGDFVTQGQLVAVIDPQELQLQVQQNRAQLDGARSGVARIDVELSQRRVTARSNLSRAESRLRQLRLELREQPVLTNAAVRSAQSALDQARQALDQLQRITQPGAKVQAQNAVADAEAAERSAKLENDRRKMLLEKGYISQRELEQSTAQLASAEARLANARDAMNRIEAQQSSELKQATERVRQAQADLDRARSNSIQDVTKREELSRAEADVRDARAALRDVDGIIASRRQQQASVRQLESVLGDGMRQLGETQIKAPVTGIITRRFVQLGELVASLSSFSSGTPIFKVEDRSRMKVRLNINEIDVARLKMGGEVDVRIDAFPDSKFKGRIIKIAPASNEAAATGTAQPGGNDAVVKYAVEVEVQGADERIKSGMSAKCTMMVLNLRNVVRVPRTALVTDEQGQSFVLAYVGPPDPKKKLRPGQKPRPESRRVPVRVGQASGAWIQILEGVQAGDRLVLPEFTGPARTGFFGGGGGGNSQSSGQSGGEGGQNSAEPSEGSGSGSVEVEVE